MESRHNDPFLAGILALGLVLSGCGGVASEKALGGAKLAVPSSSHVWVITEENHSYEEIVGNPSMPFFNGLISRGALASQYYSHTHSSLPAWMWLVAGQPLRRSGRTLSDQTHGCEAPHAARFRCVILVSEAQFGHFT